MSKISKCSREEEVNFADGNFAPNKILAEGSRLGELTHDFDSAMRLVQMNSESFDFSYEESEESFTDDWENQVDMTVEDIEPENQAEFLNMNQLKNRDMIIHIDLQVEGRVINCNPDDQDHIEADFFPLGCIRVATSDVMLAPYHQNVVHTFSHMQGDEKEDLLHFIHDCHPSTWVPEVLKELLQSSYSLSASEAEEVLKLIYEEKSTLYDNTQTEKYTFTRNAVVLGFLDTEVFPSIIEITNPSLDQYYLWMAQVVEINGHHLAGKLLEDIQDYLHQSHEVEYTILRRI